MAEMLSVFVTTFNNDATLDLCLKSAAFADEIVVLDSHSTDRTEAIARQHHAKFHQQAFQGYGPQKQAALELTSHRWVLLLDADEALGERAQAIIRDLLAGSPSAAGYTLPRIEQLFWRLQSPATRANRFLRLFDKTRGSISDMPIHAAPQVDGQVEHLQAPFYHFGEISIESKVERINRYSSGLVTTKTKARLPLLRALIYPPIVFLRAWIFKRQFLNGRAGLYASVVMAFYAFLKYAKVDESRQPPFKLPDHLP